MRYKAEKIKKKESMFLWFTRYCGKCLLAFWLESVPLNDGAYPICPICKEHIWMDVTVNMKTKGRIKEKK